MESEGSKICFRSSSHLVCFLFVVPLLKRLFVDFTLRSLCIILTSDYCNKQKHTKPPKITNNIQNSYTSPRQRAILMEYKVLRFASVTTPRGKKHTGIHHMDEILLDRTCNNQVFLSVHGV